MQESIEKDARRIHWDSIWRRLLKDIEERGTLLEIERGGKKFYRANPSIRELERVERILQAMDKLYGDKASEKIAEVLDAAVVGGGAKLGTPSSERRSRGQSANRRRG